MEALMTVGGFVPLSYVFYGVIQNARQHRELDRLGLVLAFTGVLLPVSLITWGLLSGQTDLFLTLAALASAGVMILFGLIAFTQDVRANRPLSRSNGLMSVGAGLLIIAAVLLITQVLPLTGLTGSSASTAMPEAFATMPQVAAVTGANSANAESAASSETTATLDTALPAMPAGFALPGASEPAAAEVPAAPAGFTSPGAEAVLVSAGTETEEPAANVTMTLDDFIAGVLADVGEVQIEPVTTEDGSSSTVSGGEPAAAVPESAAGAAAVTCQAVVRNNLNLRAEPGAEGELLLTIPYSTLLAATTVSDGNWWRVTYNGVEGWVSGDYLDWVGACSLQAS